MWVFLPGLLVELLGILILVVGLLKDSLVEIVSGACLIVVAVAIHVLQISRRSRSGSGATVPTQPSHTSPPGSATGSWVLYEDRLVRITGDSITFQNYSLFLRPRTVCFADIDHIDVKTSRLGTGKYRMWGSGDFSTWFPLDANRSSRDRIFHLSLKTLGMNIGFTVEHPLEVTGILQKKNLVTSDETTG
jgi:hypothetical protein